MADLPDDALAKVYVDGAGARRARSKQRRARAGRSPALAGVAEAGSRRRCRRSDDGLALQRAHQGRPGIGSRRTRAALLDEVPAGALVCLSFKGLDATRSTS